MSFAIPNTLNKFLQPREVGNPRDFSIRWKLASQQGVLRSEELELDEKIVRSADDIRGYFSNLIELDEERGNTISSSNSRSGIRKLGGAFYLPATDTSLLVTITVDANLTAIFSAVLSDEYAAHTTS